jgi:hypothetical protein
MSDFEIIHMPEYGALFAINVFIDDTPIIRVDFKTPVFQLLA